MKVMSVLNLGPRKLGSFEEYTIALSRSLTGRGDQSILVFNSLPPDSLRHLYSDAGAVLETKVFGRFGRESARALSALMRRHRPDLVHFHFMNVVSLDVLLAGVTPGVRVVYSDHGSDVPKKPTLLRHLGRRSLMRTFSSVVDQVVGPSDYVHARLVQMGVAAGKVLTIHNGVNLERLRGAGITEDIRARYGLKPGGMIVLSVSQVIPEKGVGYLIDAAARVLQRGADVSFIHVGDGRCTAEYRAKVRELGIEHRFIFAGLLDFQEIGSILRQSDVYTLPCTWGEAFSLALLEALAVGLPVIVTRVGGNAEAVKEGRDGLIVPPADAAALADAVLALHDDPERRRKMTGSADSFGSYFGMQRWVDETVALYDRLLCVKS
jgi:glycosyltransferase involved in cell wall biosynthesis